MLVGPNSGLTKRFMLTGPNIKGSGPKPSLFTTAHIVPACLLIRLEFAYKSFAPPHNSPRALQQVEPSQTMPLASGPAASDENLELGLSRFSNTRETNCSSLRYLPASGLITETHWFSAPVTARIGDDGALNVSFDMLHWSSCFTNATKLLWCCMLRMITKRVRSISALLLLGPGGEPLDG
ncbi:hypothetical protein Agabi119p4_1162 [Agaricus bisporus var. burnettii]|uniref:Uncharacterized protein n=1 Tax=Agaricus bisporus var. burnettii TaxID=192524 RepID=A0A8H7FBX2_AGABI|nr:hypothetical protein Agabi119p4_1162 [Agaricus bisporus var. burnettii]